MTLNSCGSLTYLIPTHNRAHFLARLIRYLAEVNCPNVIHIADSSNDSQAAINADIVSRYRSKLRLQIKHYDLGMFDKCTAALDQIQTPYTAFNADDDFQFPTAINDCVQFLEQHPDYGTCMGRTAIFHAGAATVRRIEHCTIDAESPLQRCFELSLQANFSSFYGVHRTPLLARRFRLVAENTDYRQCRIIPEILLAQLLALQGKLGLIPATSLIKQSHAANESTLSPGVQNPDQAWFEYERYRRTLGSVMLESAPQQSPRLIRRLIDRNFRLLYPAPLQSRYVMLKRLIRERRKLMRQLSRVRKFGIRYPAQQKGTRLSINAFAAEHPAHALAVQLIDSEHPSEQLDRQAA